MTDLTVRYGTHRARITLPNDVAVEVLTMDTVGRVPDEAKAIRYSLANPLAGLPLTLLATGKQQVVISICDFTRPVPYGRILPIVIETLVTSGVSIANITLLIATGTHRPCSESELIGMFGFEVLQCGVQIYQHDCTDERMLTCVGKSPTGIPVFINSLWVNCDLRISAGLIEPHFMAGYSGGRKLVVPGIAGLETIMEWHSPRFIESALAVAGNLDRNPVADENLAMASLCPSDFICDVTLNEAHQITGVWSGEMLQAWLYGTKFVAGCQSVAVQERPRVVITSAGGYPLDATFYQTIKGLISASNIVAKGGVIVCFSELREGLGSSQFTQLFEDHVDLHGFTQRIQGEKWVAVAEQWQLEMLCRSMHAARIIIVTTNKSLLGVKRAGLKFVDFEMFSLSAEDLELSQGVCVIPDGPYIIPYVRTFDSRQNTP